VRGSPRAPGCTRSTARASASRSPCSSGARGARAGVAWGLFLELFQLTLYPGWLDIRLYREFAMISSLGHVVYGLVLGAGTRRLLARPDAVALAVVRGSAPPVGIHRP
jgi:hypothetical protein